MTIEPAQRDELPAALALLYNVTEEERPAYLAHAFRLMARGELDPIDFLLARRAGQLIGVVACREMPGRTAIVWPPRTEPPGQHDVEDELIQTAINQLTTSNVLETFLPPEQADLAEPLLRNGFKKITNVLHLEHPGGVIAPPGDIELQSNPDVDSTAFQHLLLRCHEETFDVPELNEFRTLDDMLAGYLDQSPETHLWSIITWQHQPVGVVITNPGEICFLGLVPEMRGQGFGQVALMQVLDRMSGICRLIVDERNWPALRMYRSAGFEPIEKRLVYMAALDD